jgi:apolipoprotein N-acyltransferase
MGRILFFTSFSFLLVTFGQQGLLPWLGLFAASIGYALFFVAISDLSAKKRFWFGTLFFSISQLIQLYWLTSHPYNYIYAVWILLSFLIGCQFGLTSLFATRKRLESVHGFLLLPALWTLLEYSRLYFFTGFTFNPIGQHFCTNTTTLQAASLFGIYGLSFWVILTNTMAYRLFFKPKLKQALFFLLALALPIAYGFVHRVQHEKKKEEYNALHPLFKCLIIQQRELPEEANSDKAQRDYIEDAFLSWQQIVDALQPYSDRMYDLILFPEIVVPFQGEAPFFEQKATENMLSKLQHHIALDPIYERKGKLYVSSYAISKAIASIFNCPVVIGLEGADYDMQRKKSNYYNSAYFIPPTGTHTLRYDKTILLPMGEYIPFEFAKPLAASYGLFDSFKRGVGPVVFPIHSHKIGPSVCYEDTFGTFMRKTVKAGATLFVNLTNDGWYPNSKLGLYHMELARIRTVENGRPLLRACNFGISGAIDSLGNTVKLVSYKKLTSNLVALPVQVSTYHYSTLYTKLGDAPVLMSSLAILFGAIFCFTRRKYT